MHSRVETESLLDRPMHDLHISVLRKDKKSRLRYQRDFLLRVSRISEAVTLPASRQLCIRYKPSREMLGGSQHHPPKMSVTTC